MTTTPDAIQQPTAPPPIDWLAPANDGPLRQLLDVWIVLPSQLAGGRRTTERSGEKRLMAALLADAIRLYSKHRRSRTASGQILFRETERWIESRDRRWPASFENVCETLDVDPERLRAVLRSTQFGEHARQLAMDVTRVARGRKIRV